MKGQKAKRYTRNRPPIQILLFETPFLFHQPQSAGRWCISVSIRLPTDKKQSTTFIAFTMRTSRATQVQNEFGTLHRLVVRAYPNVRRLKTD